MYRSCLRLSTRPARRSTSRWCESVGPGTSTASWISLTETSRLARARKKKTCSRVKWARALRSSTWLSLASSLASGSVGAPSSQASSRSRSSGRLRRRWSDGSPVSAGRSPSNHAEMPKPLLDRFTFFGRAGADAEQFAHQSACDQLHEDEIGHGDSAEEHEVRAREWHEAERSGQRGEGQDHADQHHEHRGHRQREARPAAQGIASGPDDEEDERLGRERLDEPTRLEQSFGGAKDPQQHPKREEVVDRADGPDHHHEPLDDPDVPPLRGPDEFFVDIVGGDGDLGEIVEEVVEQDLGRQHRQEGQEEERTRHAEHVAEVRAGPHQQVLHHVAEGPAALENSGVEDVQVAFKQDDVGSVLGDVDGGRDGHADVRRVDGRRVVDAVAQEADDVVATLEREDDAVFLRGGDAGEDGRLLSYRGESAVGHALDLVATDDAGTVEADVTAEVLGDKLVVAG